MRLALTSVTEPIIIKFDLMRVIAGRYRGRRLRTVPGLAVRPTSDRLRETLFNIIAPSIEDAHFLDICAGSGAVGIEALSRGAYDVTFVERSERATAVIHENLTSLGIEERATIIRSEAARAIGKLAGEGLSFDIAFFDPPYSSQLYSQVMIMLGSTRLIGRSGIVIVEHKVKAPLEPSFDGLRVYREVKQGESALTFYARL